MTVGGGLLQADFHVFAEVFSEGNTVEILTGMAVSQWSNVKNQREKDKQAHSRAQANHNADDLATTIKLAKADIRHQGKS